MWIEITASTGVYNSLKVTPLAGVWIEIRRPWAASATWRTVTPLAGVWIEINNMHDRMAIQRSLPLRECGLKCSGMFVLPLMLNVTPLAGVWIEIGRMHIPHYIVYVTPLAGVWIEII